MEPGTLLARRYSLSRRLGHGGIPLQAPVIDLAFSSMSVLHLDLFALDRAGFIHQRSGNQSAWSEMHGPAGSVTAIAAGSLRSLGSGQGLFAIVDGAVRYTWWSRGQKAKWSTWRPLPKLDPPVVDIACSSPRTGHLTVSALDSSAGIIYRCHLENHVWSSWTAMPAPDGQVVSIAAGENFGNGDELIALTTDGTPHIV